MKSLYKIKEEVAKVIFDQDEDNRTGTTYWEWLLFTGDNRTIDKCVDKVARAFADECLSVIEAKVDKMIPSTGKEQ